MPLPLAHGLLGAGIVAALSPPSHSHLRRLMLVGALLGICPDFDYALNWLRIAGGGWHHGFTHSVVFAFLLGAVVAVASKHKGARGFFAFSAAALSHTLLDYLVTRSRGVALWWPLTDRRYRLRLPSLIDYSWGGGSVWETAGEVLRISLAELALCGPALLGVLLIRQWVRKRHASA